MMQTENKSLAVLLHDRECPFGYQCLSPDCIECMKLHAEEQSAAAQNG